MSSLNDGTKPAADTVDCGLEEAFASMSLSQVEDLQCQEQKRLLNVIDSLRDLGIEDLQTKIPQLIVCGGQSAGKSSVLEAICGVPFPKGESLCTRFASEIALRREPEQSIEVTIRPDPYTKRSGPETKQIREFLRFLDSFDEFPDLIENEIKPLMGLQTSNKNTGLTFSRDVLCVQYSGPKNQPLTIVDLPGLIHATTDAQNGDDPGLVDELNQSYMRNPASIILTVVVATTDWENQAIVQHAKKIDPEGKRTLGIITKLDRVPRGSQAEKKLLRLAQNKDRALELGWHVVRNIDTAKQGFTVKAEQRDAQELGFFRRSQFREDLRAKLGVGIASLRERLSHILFNSIEDSIDSLLKEVDTHINDCREELERLGKARPTIDEQRAYLAEISQKFFKISQDAIYGHYMENDLLSKDENADLKLCSKFMKLHDDFADDMLHSSAKWEHVEEGKATQTKPNKYGAMVQITWTQANEIVQNAVDENRGIELPGLPNRQAVQSLFMKYAECWGNIARQHVEEVVELIGNFVEKVLKQLTNEHTAANIFHQWLSAALEENAKDGFNALERLLEVHRHSPLTVNRRFQEKLVENREFGQQPDSSVVEGKAEGETELLRNETYISMISYYETACDTFIDNVPTLAIWSPTVYRLPETFDFKRIAEMDATLVHSIAAEPAYVSLRRERLHEELDTLTKGRKELQRHATARRIGKSTRDTVPERPSTPDPRPAEANTASPSSATANSARSFLSTDRSVDTAATSPSPTPARKSRPAPEAESETLSPAVHRASKSADEGRRRQSPLRALAWGKHVRGGGGSTFGSSSHPQIVVDQYQDQAQSSADASSDEEGL